MKKITLSPLFQKKLLQLQKKDLKLFKKIKKQFELFKINQQHPSLRLHKLSGELKNTWSLSVTMNLRMIFIEENTEYYFFEIGTHDQIYKRKKK